MLDLLGASGFERLEHTKKTFLMVSSPRFISQSVSLDMSCKLMEDQKLLVRLIHEYLEQKN